MVWRRLNIVFAHLRTIPLMIVFGIADIVMCFLKNETKIKLAARAGFPFDPSKDRFFKWSAFKNIALKISVDLNKKAKQGEPFIDVPVVDLNGKQLQLSNYLSLTRPLVLNFGSVS